jgi:hypothetical protein
MPRLEIRLIQGNIVSVDSPAWVLGICQDVTPSGAAHDVDAQLDGAISQFTARRLFSGAAGEVFMLPAHRHAVPVEAVVFAGLGAFDRLTSDVQQFVSENVIRTLIHARMDEFACLIFGTRSGCSVESALESMLRGFVRGIRDADGESRFRRIVICEIEAKRVARIRAGLRRLLRSPLFDGFDVVFDERNLVARALSHRETEGRVRAPRVPAPPDPVYLLVRRERDVLHSSLLTAGDKATVVTCEKTFSNLALENHLMRLSSLDFDIDELRRFGLKLTRMVLPRDLLAALDTMRDRHLVVVHDRESSQIPWETLVLSRNITPALAGGMSRRYVAGNLSIAKWLEQRRREKTLSVLLVVNPTNDLPSADSEGRRLEALAKQHPAVRLTTLRRKQATKSTLLKLLQSGDFDLVHYAGHAFFDADTPESSGIVCAGARVLSGRELSGLGNLPSLVFFNACEAGRIRRASTRKRVEISAGLAEAFLRGGVANYVGTYWPVGDESASTFAASFYRDILTGHSIGDALRAARNKLYRADSIDWADYIHYGDYQFSLKSGGATAGRAQ